MKSYICFPMPSEGRERGGIVRGLSRILPSANPSFERVYGRVTMWHVEIDEAGRPLREVGFDSDVRALAVAPRNGNYGCIVDSPVTFKPIDYDQISANQFEAEWQSFDATRLT